jgi:hypothetical protein
VRLPAREPADVLETRGSIDEITAPSATRKRKTKGKGGGISGGGIRVIFEVLATRRPPPPQHAHRGRG